MAAGDVTVLIVNNDPTSVDTAMTSLHVSCSSAGHFMQTSIGPNDEQVLCVGIEEA